MIDSCLKMLNKVRDMPRELGEVLVSSSGKSVDGKHIIDWAFVELSSCGQQRDGDQIFQPNILPRVPESHNLMSIPETNGNTISARASLRGDFGRLSLAQGTSSAAAPQRSRQAYATASKHT